MAPPSNAPAYSTTTNSTSSESVLNDSVRHAYPPQHTDRGHNGRRSQQCTPRKLSSRSLERSPLGLTLTNPLTPPPDSPVFGSIDKFEERGFLGSFSERGDNTMRRPRVRPRGESDLGKPATRLEIPDSPANIAPIVEEASARTRAWLPSLTELATGILIPLPYLLASLAFPVQREAVTRNVLLMEDLENFAKHPGSATNHPEHIHDPNFPFVETCGLAGLTLLLVGLLSWVRSPKEILYNEKEGASVMSNTSTSVTESKTLVIIQRAAIKILGVCLPLYAALQLGGARAALALLLSIALGAPSVLQADGALARRSIRQNISAQKAVIAWLGLVILSDFFGLSISANHPHELLLGYSALAVAAFVLPPPLSIQGWATQVGDVSVNNEPHRHQPKGWVDTPPATPQLSYTGLTIVEQPGSELVATNIGAGTALLAVTGLLSFAARSSITLDRHTLIFGLLALIASAALITIARPAALHTNRKLGVFAGCMVVSFFGVFYRSVSHQLVLAHIAWSTLAYLAVVYDDLAQPSNQNNKARKHAHGAVRGSWITIYLLSHSTPGSLVHGILENRDSRRIMYFALLNLSFMVVQFSYGVITGSLGLLTDSIHMLFDCAGLAIGLFATIMSRWPASTNFPYGYGKVETLSGFANGILLILVCVEIVFDAIHRLHEGAELRRLDELLIVSTLGFVVNMVGLLAFGHAHHGHDHGHSHSHTEPNYELEKVSLRSSHSQEGDHLDHRHHHHHHHSRDCSNGSRPNNVLESLGPAQGPSVVPEAISTNLHQEHGHHHDNENMQGIFLHILADTLGSVAVIISTLLTKWNGWNGWDPLASCIISVLIFLSAVPLVRNSAKKLMLSLPDEEAYRLREALLAIGEMRGVVALAGIRFWVVEGGKAQQNCQHHDAVPMRVDNSAENQHSHRPEPEHEHKHCEQSAYGTIHVIAARAADMDDVKTRVEQFLHTSGVEALVQVEREGDSNCWCGGGLKLGN